MQRLSRPRTSVHPLLVALSLTLIALVVGALPPQAAAAPTPPTPITYHLQAQVVQGAHAGLLLIGQLNGMMATNGTLSATTLTMTSGMTMTVTGTFTGTTMLHPTRLVVRGALGTWTLTGHNLSSTTGQWGGMLAQGQTANAGSWLLIPETQSFSIDIGGKSSLGSKHKLALAGALALTMTATGWGDGTFTQLTNGKIVQATGQLLDGNLVVTIYLPGKGAVLAVGSGKPFLQLTKWTGSFVGPAPGDFGTWIAEG